ncbi:esterase-like activity of phytase family protein [Polaribacter aestuariivivens]|uniref:Esterase-like activity of phytase family protein n=1 Tax=Polaribacter aestuariivivens TaxID=2304626 RepID=A0A5S3N0A9_9FLAO|nr:esterase-like activity of phytase family protein [Polaribacter aestuariivivens]TMM28600.1 esterase-like activity of phytase family protein [Polaribacter aestuariivivens]
MKLINKNLLFILCICFLQSCKNEKKATLHFLDEFVLQDSMEFKNTFIGGLSGVDYANNHYYFVIDDAKNPRYLKAKINLENSKIDTIILEDVIDLKDSTNTFYQNNYLDLESIFVDETTNEINFVSEGSVNYKKPPFVFSTNLKGSFLKKYLQPKTLRNEQNMKHNATFEASSKSYNNTGFWVAMEGVLKSDGVEPTFAETNSPIRITYFDNKTQNATKQFAYQLEKITKPAKGNINLNGVTAILEYEKNKFFIVERTYQNGYGSYGNIIRIFDAQVQENSSNILAIDSLINTNYIPLKKQLLFNFEDVKNELTDGIIDNIEGITFGPKLANGNKSLILVSDDNFQVYGKQLNQFILLEITNK